MILIPYTHSCTTESFIRSWQFSDTTICDELIEYHKNSNYKKPGQIFNNLQNSFIVNKLIKDSVDVCIQPSTLVNTNNTALTKYTYYLQKTIEKYIEIFTYCNKYSPWSIVDTINIQYYPVNGGFKEWHCERGSATEYNIASRHLVFMTYLNTVDIGGETEFLYQNLKIKCIKGLTTIFPADWTYTHRGIPSEQEKYIITGWFNYIDK